MSAIPPGAGFQKWNMGGENPVQALMNQIQGQGQQTQQQMDISKLMPYLQQLLSAAQLPVGQPSQATQPSGWPPNQAPQVVNAPIAGQPGLSNTFVQWGTGLPPQQPNVPVNNPPNYVQQQFGQSQWNPGNAQVQQQVPPQQQVQTYQWQAPPVNQPIIQPKKPRIAVCLCTPQYVDVRFAMTMLRLPLMGALAGVEVGVLNDWRFGLAETRNQLLVQAMSAPDVSHIFFLDTDLIPEGDDILQILLSDNLPIVSGAYWNSVGSGLAAWVNGQTIDLNQGAPVVPVDQIGIGCCLIQRQVFDALKQNGAPWPYFYYHIDYSKPRDFYSEDFFFLQLCSHLGIKPHVDLRVKADHMKSITYKWNGAVVP